LPHTRTDSDLRLRVSYGLTRPADGTCLNNGRVPRRTRHCTVSGARRLSLWCSLNRRTRSVDVVLVCWIPRSFLFVVGHVLGVLLPTYSAFTWTFCHQVTKTRQFSHFSSEIFGYPLLYLHDAQQSLLVGPLATKRHIPNDPTPSRSDATLTFVPRNEGNRQSSWQPSCFVSRRHQHDLTILFAPLVLPLCKYVIMLALSAM
jgi:hypothetical protein